MSLSHPYMHRDAMPIVSALIDSALAKGYCVSIHDGECFAIKCQTEKGFIWENLAQTDSIETLIFRNAETKERIGAVQLIYCNGTAGQIVPVPEGATYVCEVMK